MSSSDGAGIPAPSLVLGILFGTRCVSVSKGGPIDDHGRRQRPDSRSRRHACRGARSRRSDGRAGSGTASRAAAGAAGADEPSRRSRSPSRSARRSSTRSPTCSRCSSTGCAPRHPTSCATRSSCPVQQLGLTLASASAAGCLVVIGLSFIFVALLLVLAEWLGWPGALTLVGGVILIGAGIFTYIKMRSIQK